MNTRLSNEMFILGLNIASEERASGNSLYAVFPKASSQRVTRHFGNSFRKHVTDDYSPSHTFIIDECVCQLYMREGQWRISSPNQLSDNAKIKLALIGVMLDSVPVIVR